MATRDSRDRRVKQSDYLCECGCGERTSIAPRTYADRGIVAGQARRFVRNHHLRSTRRPLDGSRPVSPRPRPGGPRKAVRWIEDVGSGCWMWALGVDVHGYGKVSVAGRRLKAHRWAYEEFAGPIPEGHVVHHECENKRCVNPAHLRALTNEEHSQRHGETWRAA